MQQPGSITFGTPLAPATSATGTFGGFGTGLNQPPTFGSPNTGLKFGGQPTTTSNLFGGGLTTAANPTGGLNFAAPASTAASTGFSFGSNTTQPAPATGLNFGAAAIATSTSAGFSFGQNTATTAPNTGLNFGTFNKPASTAQPLSFGLGTSAATAASLTPGTTGGSLFTGGVAASVGGGGVGLFSAKPITTTTLTGINPIVSQQQQTLQGQPPPPQQPTNIGLGGVDTFQNKSGTIGGATTKESDGKLTKEQQLPNEFLQLIDGFKNHIKQQKMYSSDVARGTIKPLRKIQEDIDQLRTQLAELGNSIGIVNRQQAEKLKFETAKCLSHAEMAQRIHDTPPGFQIDAATPLQYFIETVHKFETDLSAIRQQIEATEKHIKSLERPKALSSQEMTLGLRRLHETFVALAGRLQSLHSQVEMQKTQYLNMRKYLFKDTMNVLTPFIDSTPHFTNKLNTTLGACTGSLNTINTALMQHRMVTTNNSGGGGPIGSFAPPKRAAGPTPFSTLSKNTLSFISTSQHQHTNNSEVGGGGGSGAGGVSGAGASTGHVVAATNTRSGISSGIPPPAYPSGGASTTTLNWGNTGGAIKTTQPPSYNASIGLTTSLGSPQPTNDFQLQKPPTGNKREWYARNMPRRRNGEIPLPEGWDYAQDYDGKVYFIDHNNKKTTWMDPRDRYTKPQTFADCIGNELPLGWEEAYDAQIGAYYINHVKQCTQLEDPRLEWRAVQQAMLRDYLQTAQDALEAKKEIYDIKQQRLHLAQDEYNHLNNALSTFTTSRTSLCSSGSSTSTKYDPDLLKSDVALAKNRVSRLKCEIEQIRTEMTCTQRGVDTLTSVEHKLSTHSGGGCYNINEAQAIMTELRNIQKSLSSGEKEKAELMQSLAKLKDDLTRLQLSESSSDISTLSIPPLTSSSSVASQTDLSGELPPIGTRLAEMARKRLQYDEARKRIQQIQQQLADLEEKVQPGQVESDKDRLLLFQEKEQLLRELRSITPRTRSKQEMCDIQLECKRLEQDLNMALEMSNRTIADRLRLHEEKQLLLQQLRDSLRLMTVLESELKILSASTLSVSSSSSLGSLSTTSSKGSLSSALSFTDIYGGPQCTGGVGGASGLQPGKPIDMVDLHKRVERLLSPRSSLTSSASDQHPPPPAYDQIRTRQQFDNLDNPDLRPSSKNTSCIDLLPLSPISETPPPLLDEILKVAALSRTASSSGTNTRSVSAAVSDESVAGDSGVFEASNKKRLMQMVTERQGSDGGSNLVAGKHDGEHHHHHHHHHQQSVDDLNLETSQIQIKLRYAIDDSMLNIEIERLRNLAALFVPENSQVYVKAALLPSTPTMTFATKPVKDLRKPTFGENFPFEVPFSKLFTKTLQVNVWSIQHDNLQEDCLGCAQVSLADFSPETISVKWYNILSFRFMQPDQTKCTFNNYPIPPSSSVGTSSSGTGGGGGGVGQQTKQELDSGSTGGGGGGVYHQESSDESTIISSQTSTLTRSQEGCENLQAAINMKLEELRCYNNMQSSSSGGGGGGGADAASCLVGDDLLNSDSDEDDDEDDDDSDESDCDHLLDFRNIEEDILEGDEEEGLEEASEYVVVESIDKETNTECAFFPDHSKHKHSSPGVGCTLNNNLLERSLYIKRSQTFSPSASSCVPKTRCRLNRSDSDSAMQLYRRGAGGGGGGGSGGPFQRNTFERRSLRWRRPSTSMAMLSQHPTPGGHHHHRNHRHGGDASSKTAASTVTARTSLDLELDLQAQHTRLFTLNDELQRLRELKQRLEVAKEQGDTELVTWVLEDQQFQNLIAQVESNKLGGGKTLEEKKIEKMLKKTSKEIYKLRKSKAGKGKPDIISFKEKMAFFTRVNSNIPILPQTDTELQQSPSKENNNDNELTTTIEEQQHNNNKDDENDSDSSTEGSKRYEYVVDRVLGVEV